jgi:hypothetical protein
MRFRRRSESAVAVAVPAIAVAAAAEQVDVVAPVVVPEPVRERVPFGARDALGRWPDQAFKEERAKRERWDEQTGGSGARRLRELEYVQWRYTVTGQ